MKGKCKYDIAISVAEEDLAVAQRLAAALKARNISYYLYTEHRADNFGKPILEITREIYAGMAKFVLMITSHTFANKYWAGIESQYTQHYGKARDAYLLQVKLDDTPIDGLSKHIVFEPWKNNAAEIADIIAKKLKLAKKKKFVRSFQWAALCLVLLAFAAGTLKIAISQKSTRVSDKTATDTALANQPKADTPGTVLRGIGQLGANNTAVPPASPASKPVIFIKPPVQKPQHSDSVQASQEKLVKRTNYCILVTGNNTDLNNMVDSGIKAHILAKQWSITENQRMANRIVKVTLQTETSASETVTGTVAASCNYQLSILTTNNLVIAADAGRLGAPGFSAAGSINALSGIIIQKVNEFL